MIRPLIISREFLLDHSPTGECIRAFVGAMAQIELSPMVYCSDKKPQIGIATNNYAHVVHETIWPQYMAAVMRRLLIPDITWLPGYEWWSWGIRCKKQILHDIKNGERFDYIHTISFPCACHTIGLQLKRKTRLPWIAQFYDPWADNPYRPFKTQLFKEKDWALEREVAENADIIIHTNEPIANLWRERYGKEIAKKIIVLPLTIPLPSIQVSDINHKDGDVLTISHIGNFMLNRTSVSFINAISRLLEERPFLREKIIVNYIGRVTEREKELINERGLSKNFNLVGSISPTACEVYYQQSDAFLAVDGVNKDNIFFPSKILKYFYFKRPIIGITPKGSVLDYELRASGHAVFTNDDIESIKQYLYRLVTNYSSVLSFNANYWHNFKPENVISYYNSIIQDRFHYIRK